MTAGVKPGSAQGDRLDVLMTLVEAYEKAHHALGPADPIEAIKLRMEQGDIAPTDLADVFGTRGRASEILQKRRRMSLDMIRALHKRLDIPLDVLAREYKLKSPRRTTSPRKNDRRKAA